MRQGKGQIEWVISWKQADVTATDCYFIRKVDNVAGYQFKNTETLQFSLTINLNVLKIHKCSKFFSAKLFLYSTTFIFSYFFCISYKQMMASNFKSTIFKVYSKHI